MTFYIAKLIGFFLRLKNPNAGTALPGYILHKLNKKALLQFTKQLRFVILITGTNGKTTTKALISEVLNDANISHITNKSGSNMIQGLLSMFLKNSNIFLKLKTDFAVLEIEEATLPKIAKMINPNILIVTNLFRDQLDAYGEVTQTRKYILQSIKQFKDTTLILNFDDPLVSSLNNGYNNQTYKFAIDSNIKQKFLFEKESTIPLNLKNFKKNKENIIKATHIKIKPDLTTEFKIDQLNVTLNVAGIFQIYNALSAFIACKQLNISEKVILQTFKNFQPTFGRGEILTLTKNNKSVHFQIFLVKNPAGLSLSLSTLQFCKNPNQLLFILNDNIADGRDVSWIWDAKLELLNDIRPKTIYTSGIRYLDMALRIKYALKQKSTRIIIENDLSKVVQNIFDKSKNEEFIYVFPTYTAMNEFRSIFKKKF